MSEADDNAPYDERAPHHGGASGLLPEPDAETDGEEQEGRRRSKWKPAPLLPREDARDGSLTFVVSVLCFLACLTFIAALGANRAASGWQSQLVNSATVLVRPKPGETADSAAIRATEALSNLQDRGVTNVALLEEEKAAALLEPWLGDDAVLEDLPVPRLVMVDLDRKHPATTLQLRQTLEAAGVDATVDDHSLWIADIVRAGTIARVSAFAIFALLFAVTSAVIVFATRAALQSRRDLVQVLHLSGAEDSFIADLFQIRFARMAGIAGLIGAAAALIIAVGLRLLGGGEGLTPVLPIAWTDLLAPLPCPVITGLIALLSARTTAMRLLGRMK